ncbi:MULTISPECIES: type II toxin-antitoxin system RelE family toxin [unclassified Wolbachia]|uniref:type II toxin-antitoxin system RelE family toxin n=1 Tax=unclassified Wolbachia TaxID=2640676 RepID=UPI001ABD9E3A|nr:type II toxin-antitoxin system RelE/ParE family toxin [Wolbachia endosymbiont of Oryzaephilus surinamensis]QTG99503.1 type II toxin-antitoxin system RelE/ParE family toxin [Wolbachia pipientis]
MRYDIIYSKKVLEEDFLALPPTIRSRVRRAVDSRLATNPKAIGKALSHEFKGYFRIRVSDYRVIYRINYSKHTVTITAMGHRKDIYERSPE